MVEPARLATTSTPSIGPSAWELTVPVSAEGEVPSARVTLANVTPSRAVPTSSVPSSFAILIDASPSGVRIVPLACSRNGFFGLSFASTSGFSQGFGIGVRTTGVVMLLAVLAIRPAPAQENSPIDLTGTWRWINHKDDTNRNPAAFPGAYPGLP